MEEQFATSGFSDALVILGAAGIVIPVFARFRITPIIGFILIGVLFGPSGLGALTNAHPWLHYLTISNAHRIEPFAELGIVLLLFSVGLELSFRRLWSMRRIVFGVGAAELIGCAVIIGAGLHFIGQGIPGSIGLGLALALSSTAIVLPLVGTQSAVGRSALGMLLFEDVALVPIVFALGAMSPTAAGPESAKNPDAVRPRAPRPEPRVPTTDELLARIATFEKKLRASTPAGEDVDPASLKLLGNYRLKAELASTPADRADVARKLDAWQRTHP